MAAVLATRHWESDDSVDSVLFDLTGDSTSPKCKWVEEKESTSSHGDECKSTVEPEGSKRGVWRDYHSAKKKGPIIPSRVAALAVPRKYVSYAAPGNLAKVKRSALLYEITERTNELAQPRKRAVSENQVQCQSRLNIPQIPAASPRILELSRPRTIRKERRKPCGYVPPAALRAIATERIIELSKPKRKLHAKAPKRRRIKRAPYTSKVVYLSRPRLLSNSSLKRKNYFKVQNDLRRLKRLKRKILWSERWKSTGVITAVADTDGKNPRRTKRRKTVKKSGGRLGVKCSDKSVITINLNYADDSKRRGDTKRSRNYACP